MAVSNHATDLSELSRSDARIILLYSTREEAEDILRLATAEGLTGKKWGPVWSLIKLGTITELSNYLFQGAKE